MLCVFIETFLLYLLVVLMLNHKPSVPTCRPIIDIDQSRPLVRSLSEFVTLNHFGVFHYPLLALSEHLVELISEQCPLVQHRLLVNLC